MINIYEFAGIRGYLFLDSLLFGNNYQNCKKLEINRS